jgi:hypothetical protein
MELHDLTAAYALDALDPAERRDYERHLPACERCRAELAELQEAAGALALAVDAPPPPPQLRERILESARGERANVVPLRRRRPFQVVSAAAGVAAAAALALGAWGVSADRALDEERATSARLAAVLADPEATVVPLADRATLVVDRSGRGALFLRGLPEPPPGKRYMTWVIENGRPVAAGLVDGRSHVLDERVPRGATVAITVEDGEVDAPTADPVAAATAA